MAAHIARAMVGAVLTIAVASCSAEMHPGVSLVLGVAESTELTLGLDDCVVNPTVEVEESSEIRVRVTADQARGDGCDTSVDVSLDEPVGERDVVDETSGQTFAVTGPAPVD